MHATVLFRREAVLAVGKYNPQQKPRRTTTSVSGCRAAFPVAWHTRIVAEYWKHEGNMSRDPGLMLRESLRALRKQRRQLKTAEERAAYREGVRHWQHYYGEGQWAVVTRRLKAGQMAAAAQAAFVFRHAPTVFLTHAAARVSRPRARLRGRSSRRSAACSPDSRPTSPSTLAPDGAPPVRPGQRWRWHGRRTAPAPPVILLYHRVADVDSDPWNLAVSPRNFRAQMRVIAEMGSCMPLSDLVKDVASGTLPLRQPSASRSTTAIRTICSTPGPFSTSSHCRPRSSSPRAIWTAARTSGGMRWSGPSSGRIASRRRSSWRSSAGC